jgi:putative ABC transport system permease protein
VWRLTWRDLVFRRRRFVIAAFATAVVMAVSLLMSGMILEVHHQNERVVESFDADDWWVPEQSNGPFTAGVAVDSEAAAEFAVLPGVTRAEPVLLVVATVSGDQDVVSTNLIGAPIGGLGSPEISDGRAIAASGEAVLDDRAGYDVGDQVTVDSRPFTVVGLAKGVSYRFDTRTTYLSLEDAQEVVAGGLPVASAIVTQGEVTTPPAGFVAFDDAQTTDDLTGVLGAGLSGISTMRTILLGVAAGIVAFILYLSSLERVRDVAVLKAVGATDRFLSAGMAVQGVLVTVGACLVSFVLAFIIRPAFPLQIALEPSIFLQLFVIAVVVGLLASLVGIRRALKTDPAVAFG